MWITLLVGSYWIIRDRAGQLGESGVLDGKGESVMVHKFGAPGMVAPPMSIKDRVG
jgi:hypothetical protein